MNKYKNEYFSNCYNIVTLNKIFHLFCLFLEYIFTLDIQIAIFMNKYNNDYKNKDKYVSYNIYFFLINIINSTPNYIKITIILAIFISIIIYYVFFNIYLIKKKLKIKEIIINIFEILIFRTFFIMISQTLFSMKNTNLLICIILLVPVLLILFNNFSINHLYYFVPHFMSYPYDYYSSKNDIIHLYIKIFITIAIYTSNIYINTFLYILVFFGQMVCLCYSIYVFYYKSYIIMNNIFLNKTRFSFILSSIVTNIMAMISGTNNINDSFPIIIINIFIIFFIFIQAFYDPYNYVYFDQYENVGNIYFYFFIIDHNKNQSFLLEEKLEKHFSVCKSCDLCIKLKIFIQSRINRKKIYKILYKDVTIFEKTINELIHEVLENGINSIKYNSFYIINVLYCYYINLIKKNFVLSLNLKILFSYINEENKIILENYLISAQQLFLINEFISKANNILNLIEQTVFENIMINKVKKFFSLFELIFELKEKKFNTQLYHNKNEGIINFYRSISICTMIYEELFNTTLSNNGFGMKENQIFLADLSNKNYLKFNQIVIQLDLLNFENKIIYAVGEFAKYHNKLLCKLFPHIFRQKQISIIKNIILNSKNFQKAEKTSEKKIFSYNYRNLEQQYSEIKCVICEDDSFNRDNFRLIKLKLTLIYTLEMSSKILLTGVYSLENNIVITLDKSTKGKRKEIVLNSVIKDEEYKEKNILKYKKNEKYFNNKKLVFVNKYFINPNCYNIYSIYRQKRESSYSNYIISNGGRGSHKSSHYDNIDSKLYEEFTNNQSQSLNYLLQSSSSTFNQYSNNRQNILKRSKESKKNDKKIKSFKNAQLNLMLFPFLILFIQFLFHYIVIYRRDKQLLNKNKSLLFVRNYFNIFNSLFTSILSISCLARESKSEKCQSFIGEIDNMYRNLSNSSELNLTVLILQQNKYYSNQMNQIKYLLLQRLSVNEDEEISSLVNAPFPNYFIKQDLFSNETILKFYIKEESFLKVLDYITNAFLIMSSDYNGINNVVYIVNKSMDVYEPFSHTKLKSELTQYQYYYYYLILNYHIFMKKLELISNSLLIKQYNSNSKYAKFARLYGVLNMIFYLIIQAFIFIYVQKYIQILYDLLNEIDEKMNLKNDEISIKELFIQKIQKLKIIISLYKQDLKESIQDLNSIYNNYHRFIEEKNKEMEKYMKKEKFLNESFNNNQNYKKNNKIKKEYIINAGNNKKYHYILLFNLIYIIFVIGSTTIEWSLYYIECGKLAKLIRILGNISDNGYKFINYYQLMIYNNITIEDINQYEKYDDSKGQSLFTKIYSDIQGLYEANKVVQKIGDYELQDINKYFNFNCKSFFGALFNRHPLLATQNKSYMEFYIRDCEDSKIFEQNNFKQIFTIFFENIQIGINSINNRTYEGLIGIISNDNYFRKVIIQFLTFYFHAYEMIGSQIMRKSHQKINSLLFYYSYIGIVLIYSSTVLFILIIIFFYIWTINNNYCKLKEFKEVFKVCSK